MIKTRVMARLQNFCILVVSTDLQKYRKTAGSLISKEVRKF